MPSFEVYAISGLLRGAVSTRGTFGLCWMSFSQSRWSIPCGAVIATSDAVAGAIACAGAAKPSTAAARPPAMTVANPNFFILVPSSFFAVVFAPCRFELRVTGLCGSFEPV